MHYLDLACRALLSTVLLVAAAGKVRPRAFGEFVASLAPIRWLVPALRRPAAVATVCAEVLSVVLLWAPGVALVGYLLAGATLAAFTATLVLNRRQGTALRCRCFGYDAGPVGLSHIVRNVGLLVLAAIGLVAVLVPDGGGTVAGSAIGIVAGALGGLLVTRWDDLSFLLRGSAA